MILYPTETVYGLGADVFDAEALRRLFVLKGRDEAKAVSWLVRDIAQMDQYGVVDEVAAKIAERFLPGPLTMVLPARDSVPDTFLAADRTVGFRISSDPTAQALAREHAHPITATSANVSGEPTLPVVADILAQFGNRASMIDRVLNGGPRSGPPSTVVRIRDGVCEIVRAGAISEAAIREIL